MANNITSHTTIKNVRNELKSSAAALKNAMSNIFSEMKCNGTSSSNADTISSYTGKTLNSIEEKLTYAQKAANAFAGVNSKPVSQTIKFNVSCPSSRFVLDYNNDNLLNDISTNSINTISTFAKTCDTLVSKVRTCANELSAIKVLDQYVVHLNIFSFLFPKYFWTAEAGNMIHLGVIKNEAVNRLEEVTDLLMQLSNFYSHKRRMIDLVKNKLKFCEENNRNNIENEFFGITLKKTATYNQDNRPSNEELDKCINELKNKKAYYTEITGLSSPLHIELEIVRLKNLKRIFLPVNILKQKDYALPQKGYDGNYGCCATAYAMGLSIVNGRYYNPEETYTNGCIYKWGGVDNATRFDPNIVYEKLRNNKPTLFHYYYIDQYGNNNQHWVLINGIKEGADYDNLTYKDFLIADPGYGNITSLEELASNSKNFSIETAEMRCFS